MPKSSLGKLSRAKVLKAFEAGAYSAFIRHDKELRDQVRVQHSAQPGTETPIVVRNTPLQVYLTSQQQSLFSI